MEVETVRDTRTGKPVTVMAPRVRPGTVSLMDAELVNGVYIPSALLIVGTAIVKLEWLPYSVALAIAIGSFKIMRMTAGMCWTLDIAVRYLVMLTDININIKPPQRHSIRTCSRSSR